MKTFSTFLGILFGLALLAAFLSGGYFLFNYVSNLFGTLEPQIKTLAIIASIVAFFCAAIIASGLKAGSQNSVSLEKTALYPRLLALYNKARQFGAMRGKATVSRMPFSSHCQKRRFNHDKRERH